MEYVEVYQKLKSKKIKDVYLTRKGQSAVELSGAKGLSYLEQHADKAKPVYDQNGAVQFKIGDDDLVFHYEWADYENYAALSDRFSDD